MKGQAKKRGKIGKKRSTSSLKSFIRKLAKMNNKKRSSCLKKCNDQFINDVSPHVRKSLPIVSPLLSLKANQSLRRFISRRTPIDTRRRLLRGEQVGSGWFHQLITSIFPILGVLFKK